MTAQTPFQVITAQARSTGDVVYLTGCDEWSPEILHAEFIDDDDHADFRLFVASRQTRLVDAPRLAPIEITDNGPVPLLHQDIAAQ